jgi:hypothetical protein
VSYCFGVEASYLGSDCDRIVDGCRGVPQTFQAGVYFSFRFESALLVLLNGILKEKRRGKE